jgi:hypothetical protein
LAGRIAVTGMGVSTMLGLVGAYTLAEHAAAGTADSVTPQVDTPVQVVVVIHPATTIATGATPDASAPIAVAPPVSTGAADTTVATLPAVVLTAQPQVQAAPAAPAASTKVAKTHGSK